MGLFSSKGHIHLNGHKELTHEKEIISLIGSGNNPKKVYFPTMTPNGKPVEVLVKPGDQVLVGTRIGTRTDFNVPVYSSVSGVVLANEMILSPVIGRPVAHITIENDMKYEHAEPLKTVSLDASAEEIKAALALLGLEGMGGAGFPTHVKYNGAPEVILVNGVECEPYLTTDTVAMEKDADLLVLGCKYLMAASGAKRAVIAIKENKKVAISAITKAIEGTEVTLKTVPDQYPMGWERTLVKKVLGRTYQNLPIEAGVIVNNAQTVISAAIGLSQGKTVAHRVITVSGDGVVEPHNVIAPVGTLAHDVIAACGGYVEGDINVIPGGPMCGKAVRDDKIVLGLASNGVTVLKFVEHVAEPCLRCGACSAHCPAGLQPVQIKQAYERKDTDAMEALKVLGCVECGMCSYICPSKIEVTETMRKAKMIYKLKKK